MSHGFVGPHPTARDPQLIIEGTCPTGRHGPLEPHDCGNHCAWCPTCKLGYSVHGNMWFTHHLNGTMTTMDPKLGQITQQLIVIGQVLDPSKPIDWPRPRKDSDV